MRATRILIVDDDERLTRTLKLYLEATGAYRVETEHRGCRAIATARTCRPDVILLDLVMPDADGAALAPALRRCCPHARIIFLTALVARTELPAGGGRIGGHPFLAKPAAPDEIIACIENGKEPPPQAPGERVLQRSVQTLGKG